jgi:hypothetical protein
MKKIIILAAFLTVSFFGYSQTTYSSKVVNGDTILIKTIKITEVDTVSKKENRAALLKIEQSIKNNQESRKIQNAEFDRLEAIYQAERLRLKSELTK